MFLIAKRNQIREPIKLGKQICGSGRLAWRREAGLAAGVAAGGSDCALAQRGGHSKSRLWLARRAGEERGESCTFWRAVDKLGLKLALDRAGERYRVARSPNEY